MRRFGIIYSLLVLMFSAVPAMGQHDGDGRGLMLGQEITPKDTVKQRRFVNRLIAPKGEWQCGLSVMYADFSSADSDYMLLLQGLNANASMLRISPNASYTFAHNHAIGARFQFTNIHGMIDSATADLLGNFSLSIENVNALSRTFGGSVYQRSYWGLDRKGRVGIFWDYILGWSRTKTQFDVGNSMDKYSIKNKIHVGFAPGLVYFPMNNVSIQASICVADFSYNKVNAYDGGAVVGTRKAWNMQASLNILDINLGLTVHL